MHKKAWFFKSKALLGIAGVTLAFGAIAAGCGGGDTESPAPDTYTVTVTFTDDGETISTKTVEKGKPVTKPEDPAKPGYTFVGWYKEQDKMTEWDFSADVVLEDMTLYADWVEGENEDIQRFTVTFVVDDQTIAEKSVVKGKQVAKPTDPTKEGYIFDGWYNEQTEWDFDTNTVTKNISLTAHWIDLADYAGVWRSGSDAYWLKVDGTAWHVSSGSFYRPTWTPTQIDERSITFNEEKTSFVFNDNNTSSAYAKNTTEKKPPAGAAALVGVWSNKYTLELTNDAKAEFTGDGYSLTLGYSADMVNIYLLTPDSDNLVIFSIAIADGKPSGFSKKASDNDLAGIWKLTKDGQDYYWDIKADGSGTFHTLGASLLFEFTVTEDKKIDEYSYTVSGSTLTLNEGEVYSENIVLAKVSSVPSGSGAGAGDNRLFGTWKATQGNITMTVIFESNGILTIENKRGDDADSTTAIWKADGSSEIDFYGPNFRYVGTSGWTYSFSGSTLTIQNTPMTKQ